MITQNSRNYSKISSPYFQIPVDEYRIFIQNKVIMFDNRKNIRYPTLARALVPEVFEGEALLKDLSITGCCVEYTMYVDVKLNVQYKLQVVPDSTAKIAPFELQVESRWVRTGGYSCEIGFAITVSPKGRDFQRYVDYLAWRSTSI
jgi:hypothetical protein